MSFTITIHQAHGPNYTLVCMEGDTIADSLERMVNPSIMNLKVHIKQRFVGWDIPLSTPAVDLKDERWLALGALSYHHPEKTLGDALNAHRCGLPWPMWKDGEVCCLNHEKLGSWDDYGSGPVDVGAAVDNSVHNLVFFQCGHEWKVANRACFVRALETTHTCPLCRQPFRNKEPTLRHHLWFME